ncbi:MAG: dTDP-4-dehydrorhamnose 3,5-epimerase [Parashewanella sp.]
MNVIDTAIADVKIIEPNIFHDQRGFFFESFKAEAFRKQVADVEFVQDNHSRSQQGVLRGLHLQTQQPQGKLVRVISGAIFDVAVDVRANSATFGKWVGTVLSAENHKQLWVPAGFAHGFYVLSETADCLYKCTDYYHPESEVCIRWDDTDLGIEWPLVGEPIISEKDANGHLLLDLFS